MYKGKCDSYLMEEIYMYKGERDSYLRIKVPQQNCFAITLSSGNWIEIILPNTINNATQTWESFVVKPEQVFYDLENPDTFNIIDKINANTKIKICTKIGTIQNRKIVHGSDYITDPTNIIKLFDKINASYIHKRSNIM